VQQEDEIWIGGGPTICIIFEVFTVVKFGLWLRQFFIL